MQMADTMKEHGMTGTQQFQNPRQDGVQEFYVDKALIKEYKEMTERNFEGLNAEEQTRVWGLFGDEDTTVNTYGMFSERYPQSAHFHGEHRMNDQSFMHAVMPGVLRCSSRGFTICYDRVVAYGVHRHSRLAPHHLHSPS